MIKKKFDDKGFYLFIKSNPIVTLENMLNGLEYLQKDTTLPRDLRIFEDATNVEVTFDISVVDLLQEKMQEISQKYNSIRHAVIHNSPKNTAFAMLIGQNKIVDKYQVEIFYTEQAAYKWLINL
jgi:hypothetical protein